MDPDDLREDIRTALDSRLVPSLGLEARVLAALSDAPGRTGGPALPWRRHAGLIALLLTVVIAGSLALSWRGLPHAAAGPIRPPASVLLAQFTSGRAGWVIVTQSTGQVPDFAASIDRTDDAGATWREQLRLDGFQPGLRADADGRHAVAWISHPRLVPCPTPTSRFIASAGTCSRGSELQVFQTADAGAHWAAVTPLPAGEIGYFLDTRHGWLMGPAGAPDPRQWVVDRTVDGGVTWTRAGEVQGPQVVDSATLAFTDPDDGWVVLGTQSAPGHTGLLATRDGGRTWHEVTVPPSAVGVTWQRAAEAPSLFAGGGVLPLAAHRDQAAASGARTADPAVQADAINTMLLSTSTDGGQTWSAPTPAPLALALLGSPEFFLDGRHWWLSDARGLLWMTSDGGATWRNSATPRLIDLRFVDDREGWAVAVPVRHGEPYRVLHTLDGGATWTPVSTPPEAIGRR
jgi:photosystem II stability/assembly factor-like uncharacterized protein